VQGHRPFMDEHVTNVGQQHKIAEPSVQT
jgi:hypothetical protein